MHFDQCLHSLGLLPQDFQTENHVVVCVVAKGICDPRSYHSYHHLMNSVYPPGQTRGWLPSLCPRCRLHFYQPFFSSHFPCSG